VAGVAGALDLALKLYEYVILAWVLGSWMPQARYQSWYRSLSSIVVPYISVFTPLRLNYNGIDFSAMVAVFALQLFRMALEYAAGLQGGYH